MVYNFKIINSVLTGVAEDATWEQFSAIVCSRLQLRGIRGVFHAGTGAPLRSMDELQDVEDLEVEVRLLSLSFSFKI